MNDTNDTNKNTKRPKAGWKKWTLRVAAFLLIGTFAVWLVMQTAWGRQHVAALVASQVSNAMAGSLEIESATSVGFGSIEARGLRFEDPEGRTVLTVEEARVSIRLVELLMGTVRFTETFASGGDLLIAPGNSHSTTLEDAFASPNPQSSEDGDGLDIIFELIEVEDTVARLMFGPTASLSVSRAELTLEVIRERELRGERPTEVVIVDATANLFIPDREMLSGTTVHAAGSIFDLGLRACHGRGEIRLRVQIGEDPSIQYAADFFLARVMLRVVDWLAEIEIQNAEPDISEVRECGERTEDDSGSSSEPEDEDDAEAEPEDGEGGRNESEAP